MGLGMRPKFDQLWPPGRAQGFETCAVKPAAFRPSGDRSPGSPSSTNNRFEVSPPIGIPNRAHWGREELPFASLSTFPPTKKVGAVRP